MSTSGEQGRREPEQVPSDQNWLPVTKIAQQSTSPMFSQDWNLVFQCMLYSVVTILRFLNPFLILFFPFIFLSSSTCLNILFLQCHNFCHLFTDLQVGITRSCLALCYPYRASLPSSFSFIFTAPGPLICRLRGHTQDGQEDKVMRKEIAAMVGQSTLGKSCTIYS